MDSFVADLLAVELGDSKASVIDVGDTDDGHARVVQLGLNSDVQNLSDDQNIHSQTEVMIRLFKK